MLKSLICICAALLVVWFVSAWIVFDVFTSALPATEPVSDPASVRHRVEAVQAAKEGQYATSSTLATATIGSTVALRGTVQSLGKTNAVEAFVVVDGVLCNLVEYMEPKCEVGSSVIVAGKYDGRAMRECAVYKP